VNVRRLRIVTIVGPIVFLLGLEAFSLFVLSPSHGSESGPRLAVLFAILLAAVIPFSVWVFRTIERQQRDLVERNRELAAWSRELAEKVAERTAAIEQHSKVLTTRVLEAQEEERKRIARELHDDTAQSLSTLMINLDLMQALITDPSPLVVEAFERVRALAKRTLNEVRSMSHDLRPTILDDFGLVAALNWYADEYSRTFGLKVRVDAEEGGAQRLSSAEETLLFRIAQEALTNSARHSGATWTRVSLAFPDHAARLTVQDDGRGFDPAIVARATRGSGLGLHGMKERADLLHAQLTITSSPSEGTTVTVEAPLGGDGQGEGPDYAE
jgi:two-component system, NarL family, sensor histidine kinase UhpB